MRKYIYGSLVILVFIGTLAYFYLRQKTSDKINLSTTLKPHEVEKIVIDNNKKTVTIVTPSSKKVISGNRNSSITLDDKGTIKVYAPNHGFIFEPGVVLGADSTVKFGVDTQLYYWNSWGLTIGVLDDNQNHIRFYGAASYNIYSNLSLFSGLNQRKELTFGLRMKI